ncbi:MAG: FG-GAP repeat protein, partial [Myxococcales bacterium]|nr:FG-GAP repeat protein [Myxococcales bacterium]
LALGGGALSGLSGTLDLVDVDGLIEGIAAGDAAGSSMAAPGDVDGDGVDDVLVGAQGVDGYAGAAYLLHGGGL